MALIRIEIQGDHPPGLADELDAAVTKTLGEIGFSGISYSEVRERIQSRLGAMPELANCQKPACLREMPELVGTNLFLRLKVEASSAIYSFDIEFLTAEDGGVKERSSGSCPVCTADEFIDRVSSNVRSLLEPFQPMPVMIASEPAGATLIINGREVGPAPFSGQLAPGPHQVRASHPGYVDAMTTVEVVPGQATVIQNFDVQLTPDASGGDGGDGGGSGFGMWKWPTAAAAAVSIGLGATWVAVHDSETNCGPGQSTCPEVYDTLGPGLVALGVGAGLGALAVWMFIDDSGSDASTSDATSFVPGVHPVEGGAVGSLRLRF
ncbi:PEGA domain-containing protein [Haliangium ochraceum]|uniref:PEGA domain-containing protein n=1 Tax=Haliangium ochraceum TaxID=80816 RepID=UPI0002F63248|nr:PEGA domain-containing protein [Haliangium ochraceum]